jgi:hypothetical protein
MATMASRLWSGRRWTYIIALHGRRPPSQQDWDAYLDDTAAVKDPPLLRGLVFTAGGAPNARQRARNIEVHRSIGVARDAMCSVISDSAVVRAILTAYTWTGMMTGMHAFAVRQMDEAFGYVGIEPGEKPALLDLLVRLGDSIDDVNPVRLALERVRKAS